MLIYEQNSRLGERTDEGCLQPFWQARPPIRWWSWPGAGAPIPRWRWRAASRVQKSRPLWQQALLGGLMITGMEYAFGLAFNRRHQIWDYRRMPANLRGQICLPFTLAWCGLSALAMGGMRMLKP